MPLSVIPPKPVAASAIITALRITMDSPNNRLMSGPSARISHTTQVRVTTTMEIEIHYNEYE